MPEHKSDRYDFEWFPVPEADRQENKYHRSKFDSSQDALEELYRKGPIEWHARAYKLESRLNTVAGGCIFWTGAANRQGTGQTWIYGKLVSVARVMWVLSGKRPTARSQRLSRTCGYQECVNPAHFLVKQALGAENAAKTHCARHRPVARPGGSRTIRSFRAQRDDLVNVTE